MLKLLVVARHVGSSKPPADLGVVVVLHTSAAEVWVEEGRDIPGVVEGGGGVESEVVWVTKRQQ